jgi:hypothetical protein
MLIKVNILSPFRYEYRGKASWVTTGDILVLDTQNKDQKEEIKYIMSSIFPFKDFIYLDVASLPSEFKCEVDNDRGSYHLPPTPIDRLEPPLPQDFFLPLGEAEENKFVKATFPKPPVYVEQDEEDDENLLIETYVELECIDEQQQEDQEYREEDIKSRKEELSQTPWLKVKTLVESYGLEYTNKTEAVELILSKEFE